MKSNWLALLFAAFTAAGAGCTSSSVVGSGADGGGGMDIVDSGPVCASPQTACSGACVDPMTDRDHCGACGTRCPGGQVCAMGRCAIACPMGQVVCGGLCVSTRVDRANCGACGNTCAQGLVCAEGRCQLECGARLARCGGGDAGVSDGGAGDFCADLQTDRLNCGMCGVACPAGNVCEGGRCVVSCLPGQTACGGVCRDLQTDRAHCGMCGNACAAGQACTDGVCQVSCGLGLTNCNGNAAATPDLTAPTAAPAGARAPRGSSAPRGRAG